jgi:hypothetical protein
MKEVFFRGGLSFITDDEKRFPDRIYSRDIEENSPYEEHESKKKNSLFQRILCFIMARVCYEIKIEWKEC